jgi:tetratricopeptide (TPR) repeat protein
MEKVFVKMNALNADFVSRIAWQVAKAYDKQAI